MTIKLGRLERVELRYIWEKEDRDFTPWLAEEDNISLLAHTIGMDLEVETVEKDVGPFRADILCKNLNDDSWVLIENQIERTDHRHLGQLLTYAAGLDAATIVWVAAKFTEEHRAALDWLNKITDENFRFFGLEVELWRINDSATAPKFNVISMPNNWAKKTSQAAQRVIKTDTEQLQLQYWRAFADYLTNSGSYLRPQTPKARQYLAFSLGRSGVTIATKVKTLNPSIAVELYIQNSKATFRYLEKQKQKIEKEMGTSLEWNFAPDNKASWIVVYHNANFKEQENWLQQFIWLKETTEKFDAVFRSLLKEMNFDDSKYDDEFDEN